MKNWEELNLIRDIKRLVNKQSHSVLLGIGDDTAVVTTRAGTKLLYTVDSIVDGIHFLGRLNKWESAGKRAIGAATSDIAAMGGIPLYAMLSLFLPGDFSLKYINMFIKGFVSRLNEYGIALIGGNITTINGSFAADTIVIGKPYNRFVKRSGAKKGDLICLAGTTGEAMAGLDLLKLKKQRAHPELVKKYLEPIPMVKESMRIIDNMTPSSMIDISDGLVQDLSHILEESSVGAILDLDEIPVSSGVRHVSQLLNKSLYDYILTGGDDYALLFTVPKKRYKKSISGITIYKIGKIVEGSGILFRNAGKKADLKLKKYGYVHRG